MTPLRPFGLACVIEQALNLGCYGRHNGSVKEHIQTAEQERSDDNGNENFYAGVNIALSLLAGDSGANGGNSGVYLVSDLLEHKFLPHSFFDLFCGFLCFGLFSLFSELLLVSRKHGGFQALTNFGLDGVNDITADILTVSVLKGRIRHRNELCVLGLDYSDIVDSKGTVHGDRSKSLEGLAVLDDLAGFSHQTAYCFSSFHLGFLYK